MKQSVQGSDGRREQRSISVVSCVFQQALAQARPVELMRRYDDGSSQVGQRVGKVNHDHFGAFINYIKEISGGGLH